MLTVLCSVVSFGIGIVVSLKLYGWAMRRQQARVQQCLPAYAWEDYTADEDHAIRQGTLVASELLRQRNDTANTTRYASQWRGLGWPFPPSGLN